MSDIFICYARTDSAIATKLRDRLLAQGWTVFLDAQTPVGQRYDQVIEAELDVARAVVVLWSIASRDSHDVRDEAKSGRDRNVLFPALIERVRPPLGFGHTQTADLVGWSGEPDAPGLLQLLAALRLHLGGEQTEPGAALPEPKKSPSLSPGETFRDALKTRGEGPLMVVIPAGRFLMGSPPDEPERLDSEGPQHEVTIAQPFAMGVYAVTFDEYDRYVELANVEKPGDNGWGRGKRPVINVSWDDAQAYCAWLSEQTGRAYRLPSEAQWEYACRAGTTTPFHFGERIGTDQANFNGQYTYNGSAKGEYRHQTVPVGSFAPNDFGLYDMHGNVWEWCQDTRHDNYEGAPSDGSTWESGGRVSRVLRGGAWFINPRYCRAAYRSDFHPHYGYDFIGFRVCRGAPIE